MNVRVIKNKEALLLIKKEWDKIDEKELTIFFSASKSSLLFAVLFARKFQDFAIGFVNA